MLRRVRVPARRFAHYEGLVDPSLRQDARRLARDLRGSRILQINSTSQGGGVAEILRSETPLLRDLGIQAEWRVTTATPKFFEITKKIHNGLQGSHVTLDASEWEAYEEQNRKLADAFDADDWDLVVVHDPQPCAMRTFSPSRRAKWVWRCHIDVSHPNPAYARRLVGYLGAYDAAVYSMEAYVLGGARPRARVIPPAIDPLAPKNRPMGIRQARKIVASFGVDLSKPLVTQVSRFDPWKDPAGVVQAWKIAREAVPDLQLALVGQYADDDPEGETILTQVRAVTNGLDGVFVIANEADDRTVHAFFQASHAAIQKSLREGFGLTVSEAMWAGTPMIGAAVGGIPLQIVPGGTGFLVDNVEETADAIVRLVRSPDERARMGRAGRASVRRRFLLPRLLCDDLRLWRDTLARGPAKGFQRAARSGHRRTARRRAPPLVGRRVR